MEADGLQYWCHMCSQTVNPIREIDAINCPICESGFVEEMASEATPGNDSPLDFDHGGPESDRNFSLWGPILLGMMNNPRRRRRSRRVEFEEEENDDGNENNWNTDEETELDRELESVMRRRRRSAAAILQLLQGIRAGIVSESGNLETGHQTRDRDSERMVLINHFNQTILVQGSSDPSNGSQNHAPVGSMGDYFVGPGLDLLLQHLSENDPNRYGTPPARKEAVEALPTVVVKDTVQCSVCLDDCEIGAEVKEMPCKHVFHSHCILPWLELHSSCPICRHQLPYDESKLDLEGLRNSNNEGSNSDSSSDDNNGVGVTDNRRQFSVPLPWPLSSLFSSSSSGSGGGNSSTTPSTYAAPGASHDDPN